MQLEFNRITRYESATKFLDEKYVAELCKDNLAKDLKHYSWCTTTRKFVVCSTVSKLLPSFHIECNFFLAAAAHSMLFALHLLFIAADSPSRMDKLAV